MKCEIVSAEMHICSGEVQSLSLSGTEGELGIQLGHAPLLTKIKPGSISLTKPDGSFEIFYISGGFLEVQPWRVSVLADIVQRADDLDEIAAREAIDMAKDGIDKSGGRSDFNYTQAACQLAEAAAQIRTLQQLRKSAK